MHSPDLNKKYLPFFKKKEKILQNERSFINLLKFHEGEVISQRPKRKETVAIVKNSQTVKI